MTRTAPIRLLHTADWHLGKRLHDFLLLDEQRALVDDVVALAERLEPDALLIAGDVFDTGLPSIAAMEVWAGALERLAALEVPVVVIPGNHDHAGRLGHLSGLTETNRIHLRTDLASVTEPVLVGNAAIYGLPYARPAHVRSAFERSSDELPDRGDAAALAYLTDLARAHHQEHHPDLIPVAVAHAFVEGGGSEDEGEDPISVGGAGAVPTATFEGFAYAALGHLHAPRSLEGGRVRYAGSLYPTSFAEAGRTKSATLVTLTGDEVQVEEHPLTPPRPVRILENLTFDEVLARAPQEAEEVRDAYTLVRVTDVEPIEAAIARLRAWYPRSILEQDRSALPGGDPDGASFDDLDPRAAALAFLEHRTGEALTDEQLEILDAALAFDPEEAP